MCRIVNSEGRGSFVSAALTAMAFAIVPAVAAACGTSPTTPAASGSGFVSIAPPAAVPPPPVPVSISLCRMASGLKSAIGVSSAPGDSRLFVIQQTGQVLIVSGGKKVGTFLDISTRMSCCGERGLLGLAFHPNYADNGRFFVRYTIPSGDVRLSEFHVSSSPNKADPASEKVILTIPHPSYANHNGGRIEFGPDGYMYIGTGDGGSGGDPNNHGQALNLSLI